MISRTYEATRYLAFKRPLSGYKIPRVLVGVFSLAIMALKLE